MDKKAVTRMQAMLIVAVLIIAGLAGALIYFATRPAATENPILVGATVSLTGSYAEIGKWLEIGYTMWRDQVNDKGGLLGRPVVLVLYDDKSDAATAATTYERLITVDKVDLLLGPYGSPCSMTSSLIAEKHKIPMLLPCAGSDALHERNLTYMFNPLAVSSFHSRGFFETMAEMEPKPSTVAIIGENSVAERCVAEKARDSWAPDNGFTVVHYELYEPKTLDFTALLLKVKDANPDLFCCCSYPAETVLVHKQMMQVDFNPKAVYYHLGAHMPVWTETFSPSEGDYVFCFGQYNFLATEEFAPGTTWLRENFKAKYDIEPVDYVGMAYGAVQVLEAAVNAAGSVDPEELRTAYADLKTRNCMGGVEFDETGKNIAKIVYTMQRQNGSLVTSGPAEAFPGAEVWYPMPPWDQR